MAPLATLFVLFAVISFFLAAINVSSNRVNLVALGLFFWAFVHLLALLWGFSQFAAPGR